MAAINPLQAQRKHGKPAAAEAVRINVSGTRYPVVKLAAAELGMVPCEDSSADCDVYWVDGAVPLEKFLELKSYQKINHFPGMGEISRKDSLARNIERMKKENRGEYHFFPTTWVLPADHGSLARHMASLRRLKRRKTFIIKPHNSSMGNGIYLTRSPDSIPPCERAIVQEYLDKPFLLDGYKCDLRIYVLVTSCKPLRIHVFKDGLVRLSTEQYSAPTDSNLEQCFMHLTNYSVNKHNTSFDSDEREDRGSKRTLRYFMGWLRKNGHNTVELWARIHDVIIKTLLLAQPHLLHSYTASRHGKSPSGRSQFFEILGFDVLLDHTLQPWVLEVNRSPSFSTDTRLDLHIKTSVIRDALRLARISWFDRQTELVSQRQASRKRLIHSSSRTSHSFPRGFNFQAEQDDAATVKELKRVAAKERLSELRKERQLEQYESENKGDYVRVYPTSDPTRAQLYSRLIQDAISVSSVGRSGSVQSVRSVSVHGQSGKGRGGGRGHAIVRDMKEHELLDLLSQFEDDENGTIPSLHPGFSRRPSTSSLQSTALEESNPLGDMFKVMAARLHEEEQTQRTMVALNEMAPFYPGKTQTEVHAVLERIREGFMGHRANIGSFWLISLDNAKRKQLLAPVTEAVTCLLHSHWRRVDLHNVRLHRIASRLTTFLLSGRGEGLWSTVATEDGKLSWELSFKKKQEAISVAEMECCRRMMELSRSLVYCAYHYHCLLPRNRHRSSHTKERISLPHLKRRSSLTTPTMPHPHHQPSTLSRR